MTEENEPDIGALENETVFVPSDEDVAPMAHEKMRMGKGEQNDLRDPWFGTPEGAAWLAGHEGEGG